jgi:hypothetical protein
LSVAAVVSVADPTETGERGEPRFVRAGRRKRMNDAIEARLWRSRTACSRAARGSFAGGRQRVAGGERQLRNR